MPSLSSALSVHSTPPPPLACSTAAWAARLGRPQSKAGGFATDGQIMAMTNARNKQNIINYNKLVDLKTSTMQQLETMMDLSIKDRQLAEAEFDRKMNFAFKVAEFTQRAKDNARQAYMTLGDRVGWDTLLSGASTQQQTLMAKSLGLTPQGLFQMASQSKAQRLAQEQEGGLDLAIKGQQLANLQLTGAKQAQELKQAGQPGVVSPYQAEKQFRTIQSVDELGVKARSNPGIFGRTAALPLPGFLRGDAYRNFKTELDTLKASISFGELTAMREASKTGGALGQVSDNELRLLESSLGGLNMSQSPDNFNNQLSKIKASIIRWQNAQQQYGGGTSLPAITAPNGEQIIITD